MPDGQGYPAAPQTPARQVAAPGVVTVPPPLDAQQRAILGMAPTVPQWVPAPAPQWPAAQAAPQQQPVPQPAPPAQQQPAAAPQVTLSQEQFEALLARAAPQPAPHIPAAPPPVQPPTTDIQALQRQFGDQPETFAAVIRRMAVRGEGPFAS